MGNQLERSLNMTDKEFAEYLFPDLKHEYDYYENLYKNRNLEEGSVVTRFAPSPTGFVHMGSLFAAFVAKKVAKDKNGIFYLRIEDTDQKREVENCVSLIINDLKNFDIKFDEGMNSDDSEIGEYGPYIQSKRKDIYQAYAKKLVSEGKAYACFCNAEELNDIRKKQEERKKRIGYYGIFSKCRKLSHEEVINKIKNGEKYIIRLKSMGSFDNKIKIKDCIKGEIEFPENDLDIVIIKGDGLPTYHFAHAIDDHLMQTTHVLRGDEWLSSLPIHIDLFKTLGFKAPKYGHIAPLLKEDNGKKRKLSKRYDPEAAVNYYYEKGIPAEAVKIYLMTIANSNFEAWFDCNKDKTIDDFKFEFNKMSASGALFDINKLLNISKNYISRLSSEELYSQALAYAEKYDEKLSNILINNKDYILKVFSIERYQKKPRKDISMYNEVFENIWYMLPQYFTKDKYSENINEESLNLLKDYFSNYFSVEDTKEEWYEKIKSIALKYNYAKEVKEFKENPGNYKGHVGDICELIRYASTSLKMTPDLYEILKIMGINEINRRIDLISD